MPLKFVLNCDVVSFTAVVWHRSFCPSLSSVESNVSTLSLTLPRTLEIGELGRRRAVAAFAPKKHGYLKLIGEISLKLETRLVVRKPDLAGLFSFLNRFRLLGQDYALAHL